MSLSLVLILLTNCSLVNSKAARTNPCGLLIPYTNEFQQEAALELSMLNNEEAYQHIIVMVNDYAKTRNSIRTCTSLN